MRHLVTVLVLVFATSAMMAADDGQTQPRINYATNSSSTTNVDIVPATNGSGNVKGVHCLMSSNISTTASAVVTFTVDANARMVTLRSRLFPFFDTAGIHCLHWMGSLQHPLREQHSRPGEETGRRDRNGGVVRRELGSRLRDDSARICPRGFDN